MDRLDVHRAVVEADSGGTAGLTETVPRTNTGHDEVGGLIESLEESFKDLREMALQKLKAFKTDVRWSLPGGAKARVAPHLIARVYRNGRSFEDYVRDMVRRKELAGNHLAEEMLMLAMLMDRAIAEAGDEWINYKTTEMAMRRLYGLERAFAPVRCVADWKPTKGAGAKWRSKVMFHVMDEIDVGALDKDGIGIEAVDKEVRERLKDKALLAKSLGQLPSTSGAAAAASSE